MLLIPFRSGRNGRNFSCRHEDRYWETPPFHLGPDFGVFRPVSAIPANFGRYENFGRYVILSKKKKKGPNDAVLDLSKYLAQTLFLSVVHSHFHSQILTAVVLVPLPSSSSHRRRPHCRCSAVSDSLTVSLSRIEQPRYSFSTLTLSDSTFSSASAKFFFFFSL